MSVSDRMRDAELDMALRNMDRCLERDSLDILDLKRRIAILEKGDDDTALQIRVMEDRLREALRFVDTMSLATACALGFAFVALLLSVAAVGGIQ